MSRRERGGGHGSYHPIGFEDRQDTSAIISFRFVGFEKALAEAVDDDIKIVKRAARSTINKVTKSAKAVIVEEIRKHYNVPEQVLRKRINTLLAKMWDMRGELTVGGASVSLSYFGARQQAGQMITTRKNMKDGSGLKSVKGRGLRHFQGVSVQVVQTHSTLLRRAFMVQVKSGHVGIFVRRGKGRYPIEHKASISIASMFETAGVSSAVAAKIEADLERVFEHELAYYQGRL
ncbi:MAG: hypothetical protein FDZ69_07565 [Deltaproteobacteria bacterium]|nr:MAG: hypothetical protein FDZ69_07565 [Deltaproteobacteria bacterium]